MDNELKAMPGDFERSDCLSIIHDTSCYPLPSQGVDLFKKSFVFVPIHGDKHWSLAVVCDPGLSHAENPEPVILHFDSFQGERRWGHAKNLVARFYACPSVVTPRWYPRCAPTPRSSHVWGDLL